MDRDTRRLLGYHIDPKNKSVETYSRDCLAAPLRALDAVLLQIRRQSFQPDCTRGGMMIEVIDTPPAPEPAKDAVSTCSSSRSSASAPCSDDALSAAEIEVAGDGEGELILNNRTGFLHVRRDELTLCCEKPLPKSFAVLEEMPVAPKLCTRCF